MDDSTAATDDTTFKANPSDGNHIPPPDSTNPTAQAVPNVSAHNPAISTEPDAKSSITKANSPDVVPSPPPDPKGASIDGGHDTQPTDQLAPHATTKAANGDSATSPPNTAQKFEIQLQNPPQEKPDFFEAKVVIPGVLAIVGWGIAIFLYCRGRKNKINDDLNDIVIEDVKAFLEKIEELTRLVALHQSGCPCQGADLKESRTHLTMLRQTAMAVYNRVDNALLHDVDREEWKKNFRAWKTATEDNTDWITNKTKKWPHEKMVILDRANETYTGQITNFRNRIATRKITLKA